MQSRTRLQLEYLVCKLCGKRSLLAHATVIREDDLGDKEIRIPYEERGSLLMKVLDGTLALTKEMPDEEKAASFQEKLGELKNKAEMLS